MGLKLMIYDRTCTHTGRLPVGLTHSWVVGARVYAATGSLHGASGASTWEEALGWLGEADEPIDEIQFWGHGHWGMALIDRRPLDVSALARGHAWRPALERIRERMAPDALWWFRTCDTLGSARGHDFARRWSDFFERPVAGFTHIIGPWQSGLHRLQPGEQPHWDPTEGLAAGTAESPERSTWSWPGRPNTIHCLRSDVPAGW